MTSEHMNPDVPRWYAALNGTPRGPMRLKELTGMISAGQVTPTTLVWRHGLDNWKPATEVEELDACFEVPPPLPPPVAAVPATAAPEPSEVPAPSEIETVGETPDLPGGAIIPAPAVADTEPLVIERPESAPFDVEAPEFESQTPESQTAESQTSEFQTPEFQTNDESVDLPPNQPDPNYLPDERPAMPLLRGLHQGRGGELPALSMFWVGAGLALVLMLSLGAYLYFTGPDHRDFVMDNGPGGVTTQTTTATGAPAPWPSATPDVSPKATPQAKRSPHPKPTAASAPEANATPAETPRPKVTAIATAEVTPAATAWPEPQPAFTPTPTPTAPSLLPQPEDGTQQPAQSASTPAAIPRASGENPNSEQTPDMSPAAQQRALESRRLADDAHSRYMAAAGTQNDAMQDPLFRAADDQYQFARRLEGEKRFDRADFYFKQSQKLFQQAIDGLR